MASKKLHNNWWSFIMFLAIFLICSCANQEVQKKPSFSSNTVTYKPSDPSAQNTPTDSSRAHSQISKSQNKGERKNRSKNVIPPYSPYVSVEKGKVTISRKDGGQTISFEPPDSPSALKWIECHKRFEQKLNRLKETSRNDGDYSYGLLNMWQDATDLRYLSKPFSFEREISLFQISDIEFLMEELASETKNLRAMYNCGAMKKYDGDYTKLLWEQSKDRIDLGQSALEKYQQALKWFNNSIEFPGSSEKIGEMYEKELGVVASKYVAVEYYFKAGKRYFELGNRNLALSMLEKINNLDGKHHLSSRLFNILYAKSDKSKDEKVEGSYSSGTGWVCENGYVVTNYHVIKGYDRIAVSDGNKNYKAHLLTKDKFNDIALLKIDSPRFQHRAIPLAHSTCEIASDVFTIGFPHPDIMGISPKFSSGKISSLTGIDDDPRTFQVSVPLQAGNSGGPLINMRGEVIGIVTSKLNAVKIFKWTGDMPQNVNYAIKVHYLKALLDSVQPKRSFELLPVKEASPKELVKRVENSIVRVIAK